MTTRAKANAPATRATTRTTRATAQASAPTTSARTTRTTTKAAPAKATGTTQSSTTRKPLVDRDNTADAKVPITRKPATRLPTTKAKAVTIPVDNDREPIKAFLRLRPHINADGPTTAPYLRTLSDTSVFMSDPRHESSVTGITHPRIRQSVATPPSTYTFSHVFPASTQQSEFFTKTTLPLVRGLLDGENGLLFAYGVTNSGKTHTMQGGTAEGSAGILPRSLDVIFNSIDGLQSNSHYRPVRLYGVELADGPPTRGPLLEKLSLPSDEPVFAEVLAEHLEASTASDIDIDPTALSVDRNHEYSVWISYAEVYNERIYDLLADVSEPGNTTSAQSLLLSRKALPIRPSPPSDSPDGISGKYISGLQQVRVNSAAEAKKLVKLGQLQRRVFGTLANSQSSRSHGMVTVKILRKHRGERDEPSAYHTARLTLIDLAGSERTKHTQTTGDRLKEAGNINKSLMVLGQCMEVMRSNQRRIAQSLAGPKNERSDTRDVKKTLAVVPFRHSKLTEILMDYFVGDGRAVMIVNVNPYDTGFDENSHVMKFAALAKDIQTPAPTQRIPPTPTKLSQVAASSIPVSQRTGGAFGHHTRKVTLSTGGQGGRKVSQTQVEVLEVDEDRHDSSDDDDDDEPPNALVEALFDELENMRLQLFDAEMRCAIIEADTREEVMQEMEHRIENMERMFARRLMNEVEQNEMKMDAKIDMLHQSGLFGKTPGKARRVIQDMEEEEDVEMGIMGEGSEDESIYPPSSADINRSNTASPLAHKGGHVKSKPQHGRISQVIPMPASSGVEHSYLPSDDEGTETESRASEDVEEGDDEGSEDSTEEGQEGEEEEETETEVFSEDTQTESDDDWQPEQEVSKTSKAQSKTKASLVSSSSTSSRSYLAKDESEFFTTPPSPVFATDAKTQNMRKRTSRSSGRKMSELAEDLEKLGLSEDADVSSSTTANQSRRSTRSSGTKKSSRAKGLDTTPEEWDEFDADDSAIIVPAKSTSVGRSESLKKKKRQLGNKPVVTEDQIEQAVGRIAQSDSGKSIRRMTRASK